MSKKSISITLEETTISTLKTLAVDEMRSVSNLIDYMVAQYAKKTSESASAKLGRAAEFGRDVRIGSYSDTQAALKRNVKIDDADRAHITGDSNV